MNKVYWCPKCGKMYMSRKWFLKHVNSKICAIKRKEDRDNDKVLWQ